LGIKEECKRGFKYIVGDGRKIRFWRDIWSGGCPLKIVFPHLFDICNQHDWSVRRVCNPEFGDLTFRRNFGLRGEAEFSDMMDLINSVTLSETRDLVQWVLEKCGSFSTSFLYNDLTFTGFSNRRLMNIWKTKVPLRLGSSFGKS
jgi:mannosylglycoprotein endo-beta-mannosidase